MKKLLFTGGTGFIGRNVIPMLRENFDVHSPGRQELNLKDEIAVREYLSRECFDIVIHSANPNPEKNELDQKNYMLEDSLRIFMNFYAARNCFEKILFLGSGAEYDKTMEICSIHEDQCFRSIPKDIYGFSKYIMNSLASSSRNVYNICLFGCYGPTDHHTKFITHCIRCCLRDEPITIRQDCRFDYYHVYDLARMMIWLIENEPNHHIYNACSGERVLLSEIAEEVKTQMGSRHPIKILKSGLNREYTASNERFVKESGLYPKISLKEGIAMQIEWEKEN
ncbi:MAG: NAD(P)-dependent oxidoreductase [Syntrophomonadaceae bacterium]|nr:NAD(P)-dependent oxidoreductase [Syntrophomonadaceae bacterium]